MPITPPFRTVSEEWFAGYLDEAKYPWTYEPSVDGSSKLSDFHVTLEGLELFCDVKERKATDWPEGAHCIDPYKGVRKLIKKSRDKFRNYKTQLCAPVVFNNGDYYTRLDPFCVYGAMLGEPAIQFDFIADEGRLDGDSARSVFTRSKGAIVECYGPLKIYESAKNISAVITLEKHSPKNPEFDVAHAAEVARQSAALGRPLTRDEAFGINYDLLEQGLRYSLPERPRVIVCQNPFARVEFPEHLFKGDYDERWSLVDGTLTRVWQGPKVDTSDDDEGDDSNAEECES